MSVNENERVDGKSDWEDQDLLTKDLAADRLTEEIVILEDEIAAAPPELDLTDRKLRLERLVAARSRLSKGTR
jgi:LPS O-antigen subunit length determinant protein (WzzB/FepE family)